MDAPKFHHGDNVYVRLEASDAYGVPPEEAIRGKQGTVFDTVAMTGSGSSLPIPYTHWEYQIRIGAKPYLVSEGWLEPDARPLASKG